MRAISLPALGLSLLVSHAIAAPITPLAQTPGLSSGFGEFRTAHFHAGLDYSTDQVEGKEVRAVEDGWVERVRASGVGYGRAVYLRLADGHTAVYGHLSRFAPKLDAYVAQRQDSAGIYEQDLMPAKDEIPFKQGEVVAWSGQSGAGPPHLHFEFRQGDMNLNPLLHGFTLPDKTPPTLAAVRIEPGGARARPISLPARGAAKAEVRGPFNLLVSTWDRADGRPNKLATYRLEVRLDGKAAFLAEIDSVSWDFAIEAERVYDYASTLAGADTWRTLELLPTYQSGVIRQGPPVWALAPGPHRFEFIARDEAGNETRSALEMMVAAAEPVSAAAIDTAGLYPCRDSMPCPIYVSWGGFSVTATIPKGALFEQATVSLNTLAPASEGELIALGKGAIVGPPSLVLSKSMQIEGNDTKAAENPLAPRGLFLRQERSWSFLAAVKEDGRFATSSRRLGAIAVFADTTRPRIVPPASYRWRANDTQPAFAAAIRDDGAGLSPNDQAIYLDDRRVPAEYDPEAGRLTWRPRARISAGRHALRIEAVDRLGNRSTRSVPLEVD